MDVWILCLCKVIGIDMDLGSKSFGFNVVFFKVKVLKLYQFLRESFKSSKYFEFVEFVKEIEVLNVR